MPAAVPDLSARAQSAKLSLADRRLALDTLAFIKDPAASKAMLGSGGAGQPAARAGDVVAVEPHVQRLGGVTTCGRRSRRPASTIPTRSRCARSSCRSPPADLPELSIDEIVRLTGDAARGKNTATRCVMCHAIGGTGAELGPGARRLGPRQVGRGDRHGHRPAERRDRARLRRDGDQDQGRADHPGRADQGGRSADDAQHGRRHADHPRRPRGHAPADAGVADDERRAAGSHRAGRRRPGGVPARATERLR